MSTAKQPTSSLTSTCVQIELFTHWTMDRVDCKGRVKVIPQVSKTSAAICHRQSCQSCLTTLLVIRVIYSQMLKSR